MNEEKVQKGHREPKLQRSNTEVQESFEDQPKIRYKQKPTQSAVIQDSQSNLFIQQPLSTPHTP